MRILIATAAALMMTGAAFAAEAEGKVTKLDAEAQKITLDDGKSYTLPGEFDIATLHEGMDILLAYDKVNGENLITDMQLPE